MRDTGKTPNRAKTPSKTSSPKENIPTSRNEFKFSRMNDCCRKSALTKIIECDASLGAVVLEKARVKDKLRKDPPILYNWFLFHNIMFSLIPQITAGNKIQITFDKSLPMWRINQFNSYVTNKASYLLYETGNSLPPNCILLNHIASEKEFCLQAADAIAGAYFQKYEKQNDEYVKIIEHKVGYFNISGNNRNATPILILQSHKRAGIIASDRTYSQ